jgi:hypothetical protein
VVITILVATGISEVTGILAVAVTATKLRRMRSRYGRSTGRFDAMPTRRRLLGAAILLPGIRAALAETPIRVTVWRDPTCGCCGGWVAHLRAEGFAVDDRVIQALGLVRQRLGTPADLLSCHAGQADGFALEGHVPAAAIRRLLAERPAGVRGLAAPEMPVGSPGMEVPGQAAETYDVVAFGDGPHRAFMRFTGGNPH